MSRGSSATCGTSGTCARSRCRSSTSSRRGRRSATWGEWLDRFAALWRPMVLRQPERVLRVLARAAPDGDIGPVSLDEARDVIADRLLMLEIEPPRTATAACSSAARSRRAAARSASSSSPGLAERMFPQKPHEDPMLLDARCASRSAPGLPMQEDRGAGRAPAAAAGGRRADRAAVAVVSADRGRRIASARAVVLRARHHARDHRPHPEPQELQDARGRPKGARAWPGRRRRARATRSTISSTTSPSSASCSRSSRAHRCAATRTTCCG